MTSYLISSLQKDQDRTMIPNDPNMLRKEKYLPAEMRPGKIMNIAVVLMERITSPLFSYRTDSWHLLVVVLRIIE
jgi:hypothetical protein